MSMTKNKAIETAIAALDQLQDESYEGEERDDPQIADWIQTQLDAMEILSALRD